MLIAISGSGTAFAQKRGGILKMYSPDSPASMSILEEATRLRTAADDGGVQQPGHVRPARDAEQPAIDRARSGDRLVWNEDGTELTFPLRQGVKWHDGKPFTAADVKCTWDLLMDKASEKLRVNPRKSCYRNLDQVTANGDYEVTFHLKRPQPAFLMLLASGFSPIYPCHVPPREMRQHPIGTGPFKFVEFKPNEVDQGDAQSGLLETGPALSRRHRIHDHPQPVDGGAGVCFRQVRHDLSVQPDDPAAEGRAEARCRRRSAS